MSEFAPKTTFRGISKKQGEYINSTGIKENTFILMAVKEKFVRDIKIENFKKHEYGSKKDLKMYQVRNLPIEHLCYIYNTGLTCADFFTLAVTEKINRDSK